jgi:hypothetical protein
MSDPISWQCLSVEEFLGSANWQGTLHQKLVSQSQVEAESSLLSWECSSVEIFFSTTNWQGEARQVQTEDSQEAHFSPTLPVQDFFRYFMWEAKPEVAAIQSLKPLVDELKTATQNLSISNLTDLF